MEAVTLVRHAESELNRTSTLNGDRALRGGLTEEGREQARRLGRATHADVVVTSTFHRARETAELAWPGVPLFPDPDLDEISFGRYEGLSGDDYRTWAQAAGPLEDAPGGGESRAAAVTRYVRAFRRLLARPERQVAVVAHGVVVRYALLAREGLPPRPLLEVVPPAEPFRFEVAELEAVVALLETWLREPAWA